MAACIQEGPVSKLPSLIAGAKKLSPEIGATVSRLLDRNARSRLTASDLLRSFSVHPSIPLSVCLYVFILRTRMIASHDCVILLHTEQYLYYLTNNTDHLLLAAAFLV